MSFIQTIFFLSFFTSSGAGVEAFFSTTGHLIVAVCNKKEYTTVTVPVCQLCDRKWVCSIPSMSVNFKYVWLWHCLALGIRHSRWHITYPCKDKYFAACYCISLCSACLLPYTWNDRYQLRYRFSNEPKYCKINVLASHPKEEWY